MTLGDDIAATLPFLREQAESMMTSWCIITRAGERVWDEATLAYTNTPTTIYQGRCRFKFGDTQANTVDAQSQLVTEQGATLSLPIEGSGDVTTDDVAEIQENPNDVSLVGKKARVTGLHVQTNATARRFPIQILS